MAITRAQQAKQMLQDGGMLVKPGFTGTRQGYRGKGSKETKDNRQSYNAAQAAANVGRASTATRSRIQDEKQQEFVRNQIKNLVDKQQEEKAFEPFESLIVRRSNLPGIGGLALDAAIPFRQKTLDRNVDFFRFDPRTAKAREKYGLTAQGYKDYMSARMAGEIDAAGNPISNRGDGDDIIPLASNATLPGFDEPGDKDTIEEDISFRRFRADGGIMNSNVVGGEMDFESARQMYGLGKLVKKATRAVKKIAKSPIGKAALAYGIGFGIPGTTFGGLLGTSTGSMFGAREGLFGTFGPKSALSKLGILKSVGDAKMAATRTGPLAKLFDSPLGLITAASVAAGVLTPQQEAEAQRISDETGIDIAEIRANPDKYLARAFKAGGGLMRLGYQEGGDAEPVAKKTMPLLDMDGKEKDYRETGGFVDMGRMEKADDVPARLSKNEFVFTADAVRNAGDGSVDKGAEVMYNMMKNLEAGGEVSEESQGLEGARQMFQTSQRLEEVI